MTSAQAEVLVPGPAASGEALVLGAPISFWGGVDPKSGRIADVRHPDLDKVIAGRALFLPGTIGSSSASAVLLELVHAGFAPAAIVLDEPDAILLLGLIVAREMGWQAPIALRLPRSEHGRFAGTAVSVGAGGLLRIGSFRAFSRFIESLTCSNLFVFPQIRTENRRPLFLDLL